MDKDAEPESSAKDQGVPDLARLPLPDRSVLQTRPSPIRIKLSRSFEAPASPSSSLHPFNPTFNQIEEIRKSAEHYSTLVAKPASLDVPQGQITLVRGAENAVIDASGLAL